MGCYIGNIATSVFSILGILALLFEIGKQVIQHIKDKKKEKSKNAELDQIYGSEPQTPNIQDFESFKEDKRPLFQE